MRDLALFNVAVDSKLRGCDVVALKVEDLAPNGYAANRAAVRQRKTGRPVRFEVTEQTRESINTYLCGRKVGSYLFGSRRRPGQPLSTRQYARLVSEWIGGIGSDPSFYGTHSLRRTKAILIYRRTGNLRAVQLLLGHRKIESTVRYLGIEVDDALAIAEQIDVWYWGRSRHAPLPLSWRLIAISSHNNLLGRFSRPWRPDDLTVTIASRSGRDVLSLAHELHV